MGDLLFLIGFRLENVLFISKVAVWGSPCWWAIGSHAEEYIEVWQEVKISFRRINP